MKVKKSKLNTQLQNINEENEKNNENVSVSDNSSENCNRENKNNKISKENNVEKMILSTPESVIGLGELGESSIIFYVYVYTKTENYLKLKFKLNERIKTEFDREGIKIPYNQMEVHIKNNN